VSFKRHACDDSEAQAPHLGFLDLATLQRFPNPISLRRWQFHSQSRRKEAGDGDGRCAASWKSNAHTPINAFKHLVCQEGQFPTGMTLGVGGGGWVGSAGGGGGGVAGGFLGGGVNFWGLTAGPACSWSCILLAAAVPGMRKGGRGPQ
jgi:hypothetical protein